MSQSLNRSWWKPTPEAIGTGVAITATATTVYKTNQDKQIKRVAQIRENLNDLTAKTITPEEFIKLSLKCNEPLEEIQQVLEKRNLLSPNQELVEISKGKFPNFDKKVVISEKKKIKRN